MKRIVKALIVDRKGRVLLARRSPLEDWDPGLWSLPGGEVQPGEQLHEAVQREVAEEVGLQVDVSSEPRCVFNLPNREPLTAPRVFLFETHNWQGSLCLNAEHTEAKWFTERQWLRLELTPSTRWALENCFPTLLRE